MQTAIVYSLKIKNNQQIGSTSRYENRMSEHLQALQNNKHSNRYLQAVYNKYGVFESEILSYHNTREEAYLEEQRLLDLHYGKPGYTMLNPNATVPPVLLGDRNPSKNKSTISKILETKKKNNSFTRSLECREKISNAVRGRRQSLEEVEKRKQALEKVYITPEYKQAHKEGITRGLELKSEQAKLNSTKLFRENNPSYNIQECTYCNRKIQGASAFKRFHGENCKTKNN
jgi:hypothetical protein